jgi:hypothetical protein
LAQGAEIKDGAGMRGVRNTVLGLGVALVADLGVAGPAVAIPPTHETLAVPPSPGVIDCGSFEDTFVDFLDNVTRTTYYDGDGNAMRIVLHFEHHSNDENSVTHLTIREHGH